VYLNIYIISAQSNKEVFYGAGQRTEFLYGLREGNRSVDARRAIKVAWDYLFKTKKRPLVGKRRLPAYWSLKDWEPRRGKGSMPRNMSIRREKLGIDR
jgi:hypothetical protein